MNRLALNVVVTCSTADAEIAADLLWGLGAMAVEEREVSGRVELWTSLGDDERLVAERMDGVALTWRLEWVDADVADTWRQFVGPVVVDDSLELVPAWIDHPPPSGPSHPVCVRIEPGATFGLGNHPTTIGSAKVLCRVIEPGDTVLDVGTGSGVLAIVAALFGASSAHGVDITPASLEIVPHNARLNGVADRVSVSIGALGDISDPADVVVANILAPVLIELSRSLVRLTGRVLVISGMLDGAYSHVVEALAPLSVVHTESVDGWVTLALSR